MSQEQYQRISDAASRCGTSIAWLLRRVIDATNWNQVSVKVEK